MRLAGIGTRLSVDDAYSWWVASAPNAHLFLRRLAATENTPPLIYLALMLMPSSPAGLRIPAALPGVLSVVVVFLALRPRLGDRTALLAALAVTVDPFLVTYADLARGFMLSDLALLIALWCLLALADRETPLRWTGFALAGTVAVWTEYRSVIVLCAMVATAVIAGVPRRRRTLIAGALVLVTLAPWIPEIVRGQDQVGLTKFDPMGATPSLRGVRDLAVTLVFGEHGGTGSSTARWLLFAVIVLALAAGAQRIRRVWPGAGPRTRHALTLLAGTAGLSLVGYALVAPLGVHVFTQRYLTILVPLIAGLAATAVTSLPARAVVPVAAIALVGLGLGNFARRLGGEWQPDLAPIRAAARTLHARTVLTNTPLVLYYLPSFRPVFDRPSNLGAGLAATCVRPCLIVDDTRTSGGTARNVAGVRSTIGPFQLVYEPGP